MSNLSPWTEFAASADLMLDWVRGQAALVKMDVDTKVPKLERDVLLSTRGSKLTSEQVIEKCNAYSEMLRNPLTAGYAMTQIYFDPGQLVTNINRLADMANAVFLSQRQNLVEIDPASWIVFGILKSGPKEFGGKEYSTLIDYLSKPSISYTKVLNHDFKSVQPSTYKPEQIKDDLKQQQPLPSVDEWKASFYRSRWKWPVLAGLYIQVVMENSDALGLLHADCVKHNRICYFDTGGVSENDSRFARVACYCALLVRSNGASLVLQSVLDPAFEYARPLFTALF